MLKYNISQPVNVTWRSPHDYTTVEVWQGPFSNGAYSTNLLVGMSAYSFPGSRISLTVKRSKCDAGSEQPSVEYHINKRIRFERTILLPITKWRRTQHMRILHERERRFSRV